MPGHRTVRRDRSFFGANIGKKAVSPRLRLGFDGGFSLRHGRLRHGRLRLGLRQIGAADCGGRLQCRIGAADCGGVSCAEPPCLPDASSAVGVPAVACLVLREDSQRSARDAVVEGDSGKPLGGPCAVSSSRSPLAGEAFPAKRSSPCALPLRSLPVGRFREGAAAKKPPRKEGGRSCRSSETAYLFSFFSAAYSSLTFASTAGVMLRVVSASMSAEALMISRYFLSALIASTARWSRSCARLVKT